MPIAEGERAVPASIARPSDLGDGAGHVGDDDTAAHEQQQAGGLRDAAHLLPQPHHHRAPQQQQQLPPFSTTSFAAATAFAVAHGGPAGHLDPVALRQLVQINRDEGKRLFGRQEWTAAAERYEAAVRVRWWAAWERGDVRGGSVLAAASPDWMWSTRRPPTRGRHVESS